MAFGFAYKSIYPVFMPHGKTLLSINGISPRMGMVGMLLLWNERSLTVYVCRFLHMIKVSNLFNCGTGSQCINDSDNSAVSGINKAIHFASLKIRGNFPHGVSKSNGFQTSLVQIKQTSLTSSIGRDQRLWEALTNWHKQIPLLFSLAQEMPIVCCWFSLHVYASYFSS